MASPQNQSFANVTATGSLSVSGQSTCGNVTCGNLTASSGNYSGSVSCDGDLLSGGTISGSTGFFSSTLTAFGASQLQAVNAVSLNCTANVSVMGTLQAYGPSLMESITGTSLTVNEGTTTGSLSANNITCAGTFDCQTLILAPNVELDSANIGTLTCANQTCSNLTCTNLQVSSLTTPNNANLTHSINGTITFLSDGAFPTTVQPNTVAGLQLFRNHRASIGELDFLCQARLGEGGGFNFWAANLTQLPVLQAYIAPDGVHAIGNLYHGDGTTNATTQINSVVAKTTGLAYSGGTTTVTGDLVTGEITSTGKMTCSAGFQMASTIDYSVFAPANFSLGYSTWNWGTGTAGFAQSDEVNETLWAQIVMSVPAGQWRIDASIHYAIVTAPNRDYIMQMAISNSTSFSTGGSKQFPQSQLIPKDTTQTDVTLQNMAIFTNTATTTVYLVCRLQRNYTGTVTTNLAGVFDWAKSGLIATRLC